MNRLPAAVHRSTTAVIGLVLLVIGLAALAWNLDVQPFVDWMNNIDTDAVGRFADSGWWTLVLAGIVLITLLWAIPLIVSSLRPGKIDDVELDGSGETGTMTVAPKLIAAAAADELSGDTTFTSVSARALNDRARSIIRLEVTARPDHPYPEIADKVGVVTDQIREAIGDSDVHVQAFVHLEPRKR
ncbi:alkaline shock response membrane anchor protein AmaP [Gordonia sp. HY002]|uniref:alkaline shock response membrane anchor protein AmaP n=1 Tax=Gordonia zhenghanii TaxID=2911516 RepID=UPI001EF076E8|nr:alkaline shock response membrane anchor protein AmaP [Gordonia zhenghanii]MCF8571971.1 alkaline shock response membrane anchor protein AmaP [Gordonia zhenghanii]MCF8604189.1 alkaline shock response membrane anchor protein AmaP [Gordonia zhenghanii]